MMLYVTILNKTSAGGRDLTITNYFKTFKNYILENVNHPFTC